MVPLLPLVVEIIVWIRSYHYVSTADICNENQSGDRNQDGPRNFALITQLTQQAGSGAISVSSTRPLRSFHRATIYQQIFNRDLFLPVFWHFFSLSISPVYSICSQARNPGAGILNLPAGPPSAWRTPPVYILHIHVIFIKFVSI